MITDIDELTVRYNEKIELKTNMSVSLTQQWWRLIQADHLKMSYNEKKNKKVSITAEKILTDYSHERVLKMVSFYHSIMNKINKDFLSPVKATK